MDPNIGWNTDILQDPNIWQDTDIRQDPDIGYSRYWVKKAIFSFVHQSE